MSEDKVEGAELKKMVKLGRKQALSFAFSPGKQNEHVLLVHRRKNPSMLGKVARQESKQPKVAFGTFEVKGRVMEMTCERTVPQLAKTLKKYLKSEKVTMNVVILDAEGNMIDSDVEDLPTDPEFDDVGGKAVEDISEVAEAPEPEVEPAQDAAALAARLKALQPAIGRAEEAIATKLKTVMAAAVAQIKSAALDQADFTIGKLEAAVAKLDATVSTAAEAPSAQTPDLKALAARAQTIKTAIADVAEPAREKLVAALTSAVKSLKSGDHTAAEAVLTRIEAALQKLAGAAETTAAASGPSADAAVETCRQNWVATRNTLQSDIANLKTEIEKITAGVDGLEEVPGKSTVLFDYIKDIDDSLETTLEDLSKADDEAARAALKAKALQIVDSYKGVLDTPFFKAVDDNGFTKTDIRSSALASLQQVTAALAA